MIHCITNDTPGLRSCTIRGEHRDDPLCVRETCTGCAPRPAEHGFLCARCWFNLEHALSDWAAASRLLAGVDRAISPDGASRAHAGPRLPFTVLDLDRDAINRLRARIRYPLLAWVSTEEGAADAARLTRAINYALPRHPVREDPHAIARTRCPDCSLLTLVYQPAQYAGDIATVTCSNCGNTLEHTAYEALAAIEAQCCRRCRSASACTDTACRCHQVAAVPEWQKTARGEHIPYDPDKNPRDVELFDAAILTLALRRKTLDPAALATAVKHSSGYTADRIAEALTRLGDHPDLEHLRKKAG